METPLTPLEFARRARMLYPDREAVVEDDLRCLECQQAAILERDRISGRPAGCDAWRTTRHQAKSVSRHGPPSSDFAN